MKLKIYLFLLIMGTVCFAVQGQTNPMNAQYFQNQYLSNPALAGLNEGMNVNVGYMTRSNSMPGAPGAQTITIDSQFKRVGLGLNLYNDQAGLLKRTRIVASYAYHLPLSENNDQLHFGVSLGSLHERIDLSEVNGELSDISVQNFNDRGAVLDGDFGLALTSGRLNVQASIPNLKNFLKRENYNTANWNTFFTALGYKFLWSADNGYGIVIEPKLVVRGVRAGKDVIDGALNIAFAENKFSLTGIYHSTKNVSAGFGLNISRVSLNMLYMSSTSSLGGNLNGSLEFGLGFRFKK